MKILVLDPGYGDVKYAYVNTQSGNTEFMKFPTLIARAREGLRFAEENQSDEVSWAGERWLVGKEAASAGRVVSSTTDGFLERFLPLLLGRALLDTGDVDEVVIAVSLHDWPRREVFESKASRIIVNERIFTHRVRLIPQGFGIWLESLAPWDGVIVDIGFRTIDVLVFIDGRPDGRRSFGLAGMGVVDFITEVARILSSKAKVEFSPGEVAHFLQEKTGVLNRFGIEEEVRARSEEWSTRLWNALTARDDFLRAVALAGRVVIAGGGARFFTKSDIDEDFDRENLQILVDDPEFANVRGFAMKVLEDGGEKGEEQ